MLLLRNTRLMTIKHKTNKPNKEIKEILGIQTIHKQIEDHMLTDMEERHNHLTDMDTLNNGGITGQNERNEKGKDVTIWYTR